MGGFLAYSYKFIPKQGPLLSKRENLATPRNTPKALKQTFCCIFIVYVGMVFFHRCRF